jgi:hypothetical protein
MSLHHRYYNDKADKILIAAQIFTRPSIDPDTERISRSLTQAQDFMQGKLDESTLMELSNDLLPNWDAKYSVNDFPPCKSFDEMIVDQESNHQIPNTKFDQVPLIKELVDTFVILFPYLSIDMVWLFLKKKDRSWIAGVAPRLHIPVFRNFFFGSKKPFLTGFLRISFFFCVFRRIFSQDKPIGAAPRWHFLGGQKGAF